MEEYGYHKLEVGQKIRVFKSIVKDKNYYKFQTTQKKYDGTDEKFYITLQFKKGVNIPNETDIIVHQFVENMRENKNDKYNPYRYYQINGYEIVEDAEKAKTNALNEYNEIMDDNEIEIDENFLD